MGGGAHNLAKIIIYFQSLGMVRHLNAAPEVLVQNRCIQASDVWSLGLMIIEMVCGGTPWSNQDGNALSIENVAYMLANKSKLIIFI